MSVVIYSTCLVIQSTYPDFPFTGSPIRAIDGGLLQFANQGRALSKGSRVLLWPSIITEGFHRGHHCLMKLDPFKGPFEQPFPCLTFLRPARSRPQFCQDVPYLGNPAAEERMALWEGGNVLWSCGQKWGLNDQPSSGL